MADARYLKLTGDYYFDKVKKLVVRKVGENYIEAIKDKRKINRSVPNDRRSRIVEETVLLRPISQGLFWNSAELKVYRKVGKNFVLYSKDRRQSSGYSPTGADRRQSRG
jgi:hypothetical protein